VLINPVAEELTGWPANEALGLSIDEVFRTVDRERRPEDPGDGGQLDYRLLVRRDGRRVPVLGRNSALKDQAGRAWGEVRVFRDVTAALRLREEAIQSQKLESLAVLAGGLAHDFNNLLTGVLGNVSLALSRPGLPEEARGWLEDAEAAGVRAQGLTQQLLTFARGGAPIRKVTRLGPAIRQIASFCSLGTTAVCRIDVDPDLWPAEADEGQVAQVVQNLVLNAIEAMPDGGEVVVAARNQTLPANNVLRLAPGPHLVIQVADHGVGIPDAVRARIFDPYFSTKQRRSGLGLAVSHSIVVRHGGRIQVDSEVGRGTTFQVFLPALPGVMPEGASAAVPAPAPGGTILVMDDDPMVRRLMERMLARLGYGIASAEDGRQAVQMYQSAREAGQPFDAVILDLTVPGGMGGVEAMAALRLLDRDVRAIVTSGYSDNPVMASYADYGFAAVLPKPFVVERLRAALGEALGESTTLL
jgi:PAS domain S-box-containing protein